MVTFSGIVNSGAAVSIMVTVCVAVEELPDESVAVHVTTSLAYREELRCIVSY